MLRALWLEMIKQSYLLSMVIFRDVPYYKHEQPVVVQMGGEKPPTSNLVMYLGKLYLSQERSPPDAPSCAKELFFRWSWIQPFLHIGSYVFESLQIGWKKYQSVFLGTVAGACASWWTYINDFCLGEGPGQIGIWFIPSHIMSRRQPESVWSPKSMKRSWNPSSCGMVGMNSFFHSQKWLPKVMPTP